MYKRTAEEACTRYARMSRETLVAMQLKS